MHVFTISKIFEKKADKTCKYAKYVREKGIGCIKFSNLHTDKKIGKPLPYIISKLPPLLTLINHEIKG